MVQLVETALLKLLDGAEGYLYSTSRQVPEERTALALAAIIRVNETVESSG
jgi:hypothetical protein